MSIDIHKFATTDVISIPFGMRLKSAREARGLEGKDVAAQLRLSEKMISMLEKETYPSDLPVTFVRGYIRAYARLMEIPESEITKALEPIKPQVIVEDENEGIIEAEPVTSSNYFMQFFTYLILLTILGLVGMWWYAHPSSDHTVTTTEVPLNQNNVQPPTPSGGEPSAPNSTGTSISTTPPSNLETSNTSTVANATQLSVDQNENKSVDKGTSSLNPDINTELTGENWDLPNILGITASDYPIQFLTHLILFLLISFIMLWWHRSVTFAATVREQLDAMSNHFNNSLNLELATESEAHTRSILLSPSEQRTQREIKKTMRILTSLALLSFLSLFSMWWYHYSEIATNLKVLSENATPESTSVVKTMTEITRTSTTPTEKISTQLTTATSTDKTDKIKSSETNAQINPNTRAEANGKQAQTASISSGKYTPVPDVKKSSSKYKRKPAVVAPIVDEFSELDDDNQ